MGALAFSPSTLTALVVAVSFAAGLNVYATVLSLGVMARLDWVALPPGLGALTSWWVIGASAVLFAAEFVGDKIPGFDQIWNAAHTFVRIPVAALLAYGATSHLSPGTQALVTVLGGVVAAIAHGSKTTLRGVVTPSPEPVSNIALSTAEDVGSVGLTWAAMHHPLVAGSVAGMLSIGAVGLMWWGFRTLGRMWRRMMGARGKSGLPAKV